ncbi:MAG: chemotaxis protein CheW [Clostridiales bacterium]|jgi:purine-binding chemotaxis protein CheW|nr:chemotaxis protein CheW [Clostridiales bacterium]
MSINDEAVVGAIASDAAMKRYLTFALGGEEFCINISNVIEIIGVQPITRLPAVPAFIKGIINLRGRIIPVIDMRVRFHKEEVAYNDRTCVVVVEVQGVQELTVGLIVDSVTEVLSLADGQIVPPPRQRGAGEQNKYICGIGRVDNQVKLMLDCEKLLQDQSTPEERAGI